MCARTSTGKRLVKMIVVKVVMRDLKLPPTTYITRSEMILLDNSNGLNISALVMPMSTS